ncbi:hypothetical protein [Herbaspirillum autotrophicum]|uniref:hypothetical protein n=1 Tax=Herbaspirillum autotrophicum TaxID=180195 RepID=UPI0012ED717A|nr:hypothetical protein [Herbaspirillum autotrophicum]
MAMTPAGGQGSDTLYGGGSGAFMGGGGDDWMSDVIVGVSFSALAMLCMPFAIVARR